MQTNFTETKIKQGTKVIRCMFARIKVINYRG